MADTSVSSVADASIASIIRTFSRAGGMKGLPSLRPSRDRPTLPEVDAADDLALAAQRRLELGSLHRERHRVLVKASHGELGRVARAEPNCRVDGRLSHVE